MVSSITYNGSLMFSDLYLASASDPLIISPRIQWLHYVASLLDVLIG